MCHNSIFSCCLRKPKKKEINPKTETEGERYQVIQYRMAILQLTYKKQTIPCLEISTKTKVEEVINLVTRMVQTQWKTEEGKEIYTAEKMEQRNQEGRIAI